MRIAGAARGPVGTRQGSGSVPSSSSYWMRPAARTLRRGSSPGPSPRKPRAERGELIPEDKAGPVILREAPRRICPSRTPVAPTEGPSPGRLEGRRSAASHRPPSARADIASSGRESFATRSGRRDAGWIRRHRPSGCPRPPGNRRYHPARGAGSGYPWPATTRNTSYSACVHAATPKPRTMYSALNASPARKRKVKEFSSSGYAYGPT
jgi:hypothetical protein